MNRPRTTSAPSLMEREIREAPDVVARQADDLRRDSASLGLVPYLDSHINRKGVDVVALAWQK